jgi:anti-sigma B factor antagonist
MTIRIEPRSAQRVRAIVDGSMTIYEAAADKSTLLDALANASETEIDLSAVREMDTAGLQILLLAKRESLKAGKVLRLAAHSPASLDVLDRYGLTAYFGDPVAAPAARAPRPRRKPRTRAKAKTKANRR